MAHPFFAFRTRHQPYMVRHTYAHEMRSALTFPLAAALAEGAFTGIVASKYFIASPLLLAVITAAPMFGNITALFWAEWGKHREKVACINLLQLGVIVCIAAVALTRWMPLQAGAWAFATLIIFARVLASGIITLRSAIWRFNYPRQLRGQIIARLTVAATGMLAVTTYLGAMWLDRRGDAFVLLYPLAALAGAIGIWQFSHIRVRGEGTLLRQRRRKLADPRGFLPRPESLAETAESNVTEYVPQPGPLRRLFADSLSVMRTDRTFRRYQLWQGLSGSAFMLMAPPLVTLVGRELTDPVSQYQLAVVVLQLIPLLTAVVFTQAFAPLFDRMHVLRFRSMQSFVSVSGMVLLLIGALSSSLVVIGVGQFVIGLANAAGVLAWNLGQNAFAPPEKISVYMGVHVMLTGVRGCIAPFVGALLYAYVMGRWTFAVSAGLCVVALIGFAQMAREQRSLAAAAHD